MQPQPGTESTDEPTAGEASEDRTPIAPEPIPAAEEEAGGAGTPNEGVTAPGGVPAGAVEPEPAPAETADDIPGADGPAVAPDPMPSPPDLEPDPDTTQPVAAADTTAAPAIADPPDTGAAGDGAGAAEPEVGDAAAEQAAEDPAAPAADTATDQPADEAGADAADEPKSGKKKKQKAPKAEQPKKPAGPDPAEVTRRIGSTNEAALAYVLSPDPQLSRLSRKVREVLITDVPPVTAGALLGPDALARHFVASAAAGRYRDLFSLWELFRARPDAIKPVLAERQRALDRARQALQTAVVLGLGGRAERVAEDVERAEGLIWTWLRETLVGNLAAVGRRPQVAAALLRREPALEVPLPAEPSEQWLTEAAAARLSGELPAAMDALLASSIDRLPPTEDTVALVSEHYPDRLGGLVDRLPATVATLQMVSEQYPDRLPALVDRIDLGSENVGSILAWARDHGVGDRLAARVAATVEQAASIDRATGLAAWQEWRERGVDIDLPESLLTPSVEGLDLARPESAFLVARLVAGGAPIDAQGELDALAGRNRQLAEKAYEAFVCAELDVHLPLALEGNPIVKDGTRCPACQAWTWVRPGHERRCPRLKAEQTPTA